MTHTPAAPRATDDAASRADRAAVDRWLAGFAAVVRARDFDGGRTMFDPAVVGFGTRAAAVHGLDRLVAEQWRHVWDRTRGFDFTVRDGDVQVDGDTAWAAVEWHSQGFDPAGQPFDRFGRATLILRRHGDGWRAVHSHFSLDPQRNGTGPLTPPASR